MNHKPLTPLSDREFAELELRATICPGQCSWPQPENVVWQRLHAVPNEARERASKACTQMDEIDGNAGLAREDKQYQRYEVLDQALSEFEVSKTLMRAREAVRRDPSPAALKALEQAEAGRGRRTRLPSVRVRTIASTLPVQSCRVISSSASSACTCGADL
jgi:hypothetical protein